MNALVVLRFAPGGWDTVVGRRVVPLPTQDCSCHRVALVAGAGLAPAQRSVVVTEMASSKLLQVKVQHLDDVPPLAGTARASGEHAVVTYSELEEAAGSKT